MDVKSLEERVTDGARARLCREFLKDFVDVLKEQLWSLAVSNDKEKMARLSDKCALLAEFTVFLSAIENDGAVAEQELERSGALEKNLDAYSM